MCTGLLRMAANRGCGILGIGGLLTLAGCLVIWPVEHRAFAQIIPDASLGVEHPVVTPNVEVRGLPSELIQGGAVRGANLFHSFDQFNVGEGLRVYFANPAGIENILTRVTGSHLSTILGTLGVDGGANLFLLNPNGIIFGENARLDIAGSFVASTANALVFEDNSIFAAKNPETPHLLSITAPLGVQYGSNQQGTITNTGNLTTGQNLGLAANNLDLQGQLHAGENLALFAEHTVKVRDSATQPFVASAQGHLVVQGNQGVDIFALNHPESGFFSGGDLVLRSANTVWGDAHYWSGGSFRVEQLDGRLGTLSSPNDPIIRSLGDVSFNNYFGSSLHIVAGGRVTIPGLVIITSAETGTAGVDYIAEDVTLSDGTIVSINGRNRPTFDVRAGVNSAEIGIPGVTGRNADFFVSGFFRFFGFLLPILENPAIPNTATSADINIGGIAMVGSEAADGLVFLSNQYKPNLSLPGGNIDVGAIVTADDISAALTQLPPDLLNLLDNFGVLDGFVGNGGDVVVDSRSTITLPGSALTDADFGLGLDVGLDFSLINTSSTTGNAGDITLIAPEAISLTRSLIVSNTSGAGSGGNITFQANSVVFTDGTQVSTSTTGTGGGGNLTIIAPNAVQVNGSNLFAATTGDGDAGNLTIATRRLTVQDTAAVATLSLGDGDAGTLSINTEQLIVKDGLIATSTLKSADFDLEPGEGQGGDLIINASEFVDVTNTTTKGLFDLNIPLVDFNFSSIQAPIGLFTSSQSLGQSGNLAIATGRLTIQGGAVVSASTSDQGEGGNLTVRATEQVELIGISGDQTIPTALLSEASGPGNGGDITIETPHLIIKDGAVISTATGRLSGTSPDTTAEGGNLTITSNLVELIGTSANPQYRSALQTSSAGFGDAGDLLLNTDRLIVQDGAVILAATLRQGNSGTLTVNATDSVEVVGTAPDNLPSGISNGTAGTGSAGNLIVNTRTLTIRDGGSIAAGTVGQGMSGNLSVNASEWVEVAGTTPDGRPSSLFTGSGIAGVSSIPLLQQFGIDPLQATGSGGDLQINTAQLRVRDGAEVSAATLGQGQGGNVSVNALELVNVSSGGSVSTETSGAGDAGNLEIATQQLTIQDEARVSASTSGTGRGGILSVNAAELVELSRGGGLLTETSGAGDAGNLEIATDQFILTDRGQATVSTTGQGIAGNMDVTARRVNLTNQARLTAETQSTQGGNITLQDLETLQVQNSLISASTATGTAGDVTVNATDSVQLSGALNNGQSGGLLAQATQGGNAGSLRIFTGQLTVEDRAQATVSSTGTGTAGNLDVQADTVNLNNQGRLTAETEAGEGGSITLQNLNTLTVRNNSDISASTRDGQGGTLTINAVDFVELSQGGELSAQATGNGAAGNLEITTSQLTIQAQSQAAVSSLGTGIGGNLSVNANSIVLNNQGAIIAKTTSGEGGNISLQALDLILMRHNSLISAEAGGTGNGGNIGINSLFIIGVPVENSDIIANAFRGRGGNINITTQGIFGLEYRLRLTPWSDINASSQRGIDGVVTINRPDVDPSRGLTALPTELIDPSGLIRQSCSPTAGELSEFTIIGRGGLPPNPSQSLSNDTVWIDLRSPTPMTGTSGQPAEDTRRSSSAQSLLVEAQGWVINQHGEVVLTATAPTVTPEHSGQILADQCRLP